MDRFKDKKWFLFIEDLYCRIKENEVTAIGAQLTYYLILSVFPFLIFLLNILSSTPITQEEVLDNLLIVLPIEAQIMIEGIVNEIAITSSDTLLSLGILLSIWTGSLGVTAIIRAINKAYNIKEKRPYWKLKGLALIFTIILALLLTLVLSMLVFGPVIGKRLAKGLPQATPIHFIWNIIRIIIPFISMIIIFALLYKFSPNPREGLRIKFRHTLPGAIFTTSGWLIASMVFSYYVNNFKSYSKTYGSLGGIIVLLIWLYITSIMIVVGGEVNAAYAAIHPDTGVDDCDEEEL